MRQHERCLRGVIIGRKNAAALQDAVDEANAAPSTRETAPIA
jgi:hypothetical protein